MLDAVEADLSCLILKGASQDLGQRGFARSVVPGQGMDFLAVEIEIDAAQRLVAAVGEMNIGKLEDLFQFSPD